MTPYLADPDVTLYCGDALAILRELPDESVHCVATSPPFYGLRDYGTGRWEGGDEECDHSTLRSRGDDIPLGGKQGTNAGSRPNTQLACKCGATRVDQQIGLEETPDAWAAALVQVFREARRVLRRDGTLWVECGDSYGSGGHNGKGYVDGGEQTALIGQKYSRSPYKPKDLIGQPFLLAFALRADGWYWRGCNIWAKPNAMPESAKDRCTVAHSYVLHFSKSARYFFDGDAIREENAPDYQGTPDDRRMFRQGTLEKRAKYEATTGAHFRARGSGGNSCIRDSGANTYNGMGRSPRSVWTIPTQGFPEAHFATWPEALARRIILAAVPEQVCGECGAPWTRDIETTDERVGEDRGGNYGGVPKADGTKVMMGGYKAGSRYVTIDHGPVPTCGHVVTHEGWARGPKPIPGTVLDPFAGSGTTAYIARKLNRRAIGIDLNPEYLEMAARRLAQQSLFALAADEDTT